jgi:hypothetical protein
MNNRPQRLVMFLIACMACGASVAALVGPRDETSDATAQAMLGKLPAAVSRIAKGRVLAVERTKARFTIPFTRPAQIERTAVLHAITADPRQKPLTMYSLFSDSGTFIGAQSPSTTPDPRRMTVEVIETGLTRRGITVTAPISPREPDLTAVWSTIAHRLRLDEIREFNLYYVDYVVRGTRRPAMIVNIWGPDNPLGMPDELPGVLKNRIRFIYYLDDGTWAADNLL